MEKNKALNRVFVETDYPIATHSLDHLFPWGTAQDNSTNSRFNQKIYHLFKDCKYFPKILDLGCSGGGFVKSCLNDGCLSVGIEESDFSKRYSRAEWPLLGGKFLFNADITEKFQVMAEYDAESTLLQFDLITAWEVMEHLTEDSLPIVCENMKRHLLPTGIIVMSVSPNDSVTASGVDLHQTKKPQEWWIKMFASHNLLHLPDMEAYFNTQYVRGEKQNAPGSFHLILSSNLEKRPFPHKLSMKEWIFDRWYDSKSQKAIKKLLVGREGRG